VLLQPQCPLCGLSDVEGRWPWQCSSHNPTKKIQWGWIWRPRRSSDWPTSADPSPSYFSVQVIPNMVAEMWWRPILMEDSFRW
jgi:hypothetical protein